MAELLGTQVGNIRIVDLLGRGGMGEVYAGFDVKLNRKVAVKTIRKDHRLDEDTKARFLREARLLSKLEHPNICRIHEYIDGDDSDLLVLELVDGVNLKRAVHDGLKKPAALAVAEQIASVLEAAHAANVVHRDLKPENVMLGADGTVKVLDFGISRSLDEESLITAGIDVSRFRSPAPPERADHENTMVVPGGSGSGQRAPSAARKASGSRVKTEVGSILGTVAYMSPEQARGEPVTAASDMYSFGLLLQELFTGKSPMDLTLDSRALLERAAWGETLPVKGLDSDLAQLIERLKALAPASRPTAAETLSRLRAIRDKPRRRLRRLSVAALLGLAVLAGVKYAVDVTSERNAALAARAAEEQARLEAEQVGDFLVGLFEVSDPSEARGNTVTARELLDRGAERIDEELTEQPLVQAKLMATIGSVYRKLGLFDQAVPLLERSLALRERELAADDSDVAHGLDRLASLYQETGRYDEAEAMYQRAMGIFETAGEGEELNLARVLNNLAIVYQRQGRHDEAEPLLARALRIKELRLGPDDPAVARALNNLGNLYKRLGRLEEAELSYRRALLIREKTLPPDHPDLANTISNLAYIYAEQKRDAEAESMYRRALAIQEKVLGPEHPEVARTLNNLASLFIERRRFGDAEPLLLRALPILEKVRGPQHLEVAVGLYNLGEIFREQGKLAEAEPAYRRALAIFESTQGPESPLVAHPLLGLARVCRDQARNAEAEALYRRALAIREQALDADDDDLRETVADFAAFLRGVGRGDDAAALEARASAK